MVTDGMTKEEREEYWQMVIDEFHESNVTILPISLILCYTIPTNRENLSYGRSKMKKLKMTEKEVSKVTKDINNVWHARFQGLEIGVIQTHTNRIDSPSYEYTFINYGWGQYKFIDKQPTADWKE